MELGGGTVEGDIATVKETLIKLSLSEDETAHIVRGVLAEGVRGIQLHRLVQGNTHVRHRRAVDGAQFPAVSVIHVLRGVTCGELDTFWHADGLTTIQNRSEYSQ